MQIRHHPRLFSNDDFTRSIGNPRVSVPFILGLLAIGYVQLAHIGISTALGQTAPATDADKVDYYYAKHDFKNLIKLGAPAIPKLRGALGDADESVRFFAIFAIYFADKNELLALKPLTNDLLSVMNSDNSANNRHQAAEALEKLGYQPQGAEATIRYLLAFGNFRADSDPRSYRDFEADFDRGTSRRQLPRKSLPP